jgi:hypothetical protein
LKLSPGDGGRIFNEPLFIMFPARPTSQSYEGQASEITPYHGVFIQMGVGIVSMLASFG